MLPVDSEEFEELVLTHAPQFVEGMAGADERMRKMMHDFASLLPSSPTSSEMSNISMQDVSKPTDRCWDGRHAAARIVAADFGLPRDWLNDGPASLTDFGLPDDFLKRARRRDYGDALHVLFASREDQIHFKLYAVVDQGPGRHLADLEALAPTESELLQAARWTRTHDASVGFREVLLKVLDHFGVPDGSGQA